jgi:YD repeat-containing protein
VSSTLQYDLATGRLLQLTHAAGATPLADFGYGYNGVGNIASITELTQTRNFSYDELQRLTAGGTAGSPESYTYDPEGNRTSSHLSTGHTTDIANRLTEDDQFTYVYDANGNLTSKTDKVTLGTTGYTYDAQNQLTRIDFPNLTSAAYRYDGLGRRIEKDVNGTVTRYVYDRAAILLEFDGIDNLLARYNYGQRVDQPLAVARDLNSNGTFEAGEQFYYQADH